MNELVRVKVSSTMIEKLNMEFNSKSVREYCKKYYEEKKIVNIFRKEGDNFFEVEFK